MIAIDHLCTIVLPGIVILIRAVIVSLLLVDGRSTSRYCLVSPTSHCMTINADV